MNNVLQEQLKRIYAQTEKMDFMLVGMSASACAKSGQGQNVSNDYRVMAKLEQIKCDIRQELREIAVSQMGVAEVIKRICNTLENGGEDD